MTSPIFVEESEHIYADYRIYGRPWVIKKYKSTQRPNAIFTNTRTRMIKINLNDPVGIAVLEHFVHNFVLISHSDMVRDSEANRGRIEVIPNRKMNVTFTVVN